MTLKRTGNAAKCSYCSLLAIPRNICKNALAAAGIVAKSGSFALNEAVPQANTKRTNAKAAKKRASSETNCLKMSENADKRFEKTDKSTSKKK